MLISYQKKIILASTSEIRKKILNEVGLEFLTISPDFDEEEAKKNKKLSSKELAIFLAKEKALSVSKNYPDCYVIGSDQVCEFQKKQISKSKNIAEAINQLNKMNGKTHFQNNAVVVAFNKKIIFSAFSKAELKMRKISVKEIESYVKSDQSFGCAGSYKYESLGKHIFEKVDGDYYSILGLNIQPLLNFLYKNKIIKISS